MVQQITFIGLGVMGEAMCGNLARRGDWPVLAYDLRPEPLARLATEGVQSATSLGEAAASDFIITCLPGGDHVRSLVLDGGLLDKMNPGAVLVDMSTSQPALMREIAEAAAAKGVQFADAPIARTREAAATGTLAIMVGASDETFARIKAVMETIGSDIMHCGEVGTGQIVKIMNNMVLFQTVAALNEAIEMAEGAGMDGQALFDALTKGSADSFALRNHGMKSVAPHTYPSPAFSVDYAAKDLRYALELANETGVDAAGARNVARLFQAAQASGDGDKYWPVIRETLKKDD